MTTSKKSTASKAVFSEAEREAMKERVKEQKAAARRAADREAGEKDLLDKLAEMSGTDRELGEKIYEIIKAKAPELSPSTWYGMPSFEKDGKVVCFFQPAARFKARYATLGFNEAANLDDGSMWATSFAVTKLTPATEKAIVELVKKAVS